MGDKPIWVFVDDYEELVISMKEFVEIHLEEIEVLIFFDGRSALDYLVQIEETGTSNLQLIVSDIMMPQMDGWELLRRVRELPRLGRLPFVFVTAVSEREDILRGRRMGVNDYITKPFDADMLITVLPSVVALWQWQHGDSESS